MCDKELRVSYDLTSPTGPILHKRIPWELRPAIVEASFSKGSLVFNENIVCFTGYKWHEDLNLSFLSGAFDETFWYWKIYGSDRTCDFHGSFCILLLAFPGASKKG